jgi:hypothetical protein
MSTLYIVQAQPNPPGKDTIRRGTATDRQLNEEWVEFEAVNGDRTLAGDAISHLTFSGTCQVTGQDVLMRFNEGTLRQGQRLRLHTGRGINQWIGGTFHMYLGLGWFVWNNGCGDRVTVTFQQNVVDSAGYAPRPPEGVLTRVPGTDRLEQVRQRGYGS